MTATQICITCLDAQPLTAFKRSDARPGKYLRQCYACRKRKRREKSRQRLARRRDEARAALGNTQVCGSCSIEKLLSEFTPHATSRTGLSKKCRKCISRDATKVRPPSDVRRIRRDNHFRQYGIDVAIYDSLFRAQGGRCASCRREETRRIRGRISNLCVDHDHDTGDVRGLLCSRCNVAVGLLRDDVALVSSLLAYLCGSPALQMLPAEMPEACAPLLEMERA